MLGGRKSAKSVGIEVPNRDEIYARICALGEGALFRFVDVVGDDKDLAADFAALRGYDYDHLADGWNTGIVETKYLRMLPRLDAVMASYCAMHDCAVVETGDRVAWRSRIKQWEPILGYRYYTDGADDFLAYGYMGVRILNAPAWLRDESETGRLVRSFHDTPPKEMAEAVHRARTVAQISDDKLIATAQVARSLGELLEEEREFWPWLRCPVQIASEIEGLISAAREKEERKG